MGPLFLVSIMKLRPYQLKAIEDTRAVWRQRPIIVLPTGAGKTVVACEIIRRGLTLGRRSLFAVHRRELVTQAVNRLAAHGIEAGIVMAGHETDLALPTQVASIQTLARRGTPEADILFVDEAHHATADTWKRVISEHKGAVIGLTATPFRLDRRSLGDVFGAIVKGPSTAELIADGTLIEPMVYAPPGPDVSNVKTTAGDFNKAQLQEVVCKPQLYGAIVEHWHRHAAGKRTVLFATSVGHSQALVQEFNDSGVAAEHLDASSPPEIRKGVLDRLSSGETLIVSNCDLFGEGFDLPSLECAILARPTASLALHLQQIGRVMRSADGKDGAIVLDHAGNTHRHGLVTDEIVYSLTENAKKASISNPRICKLCYAIMLGPVCSECGGETRYAHPELRIPPPPAEGNLEPVRRAPFPDKRKEYLRLVEMASYRGWRLGWARGKYKATFGVWPRLMKDIEAKFVCEAHELAPTRHGPHTIIQCQRCYRVVEQ